MNIYAIQRVVILSVIMLFGGSGVYADTSDGLTPSEETICSGLSEDMFGICNAYCEAMDCDSDAPKANEKACLSVLKNWNRNANGQPLPCESHPAITLVKTLNGLGGLNNPLDVGTDIVYSFEIANAGNVALENITISDPTLSGQSININCPSTPPLELAVGESIICTSDPTSALEGSHTNTATVNGVSAYYGENVMDSSSVGYYGMVVVAECPCAELWENGVGAAQLSTQNLAGGVYGANYPTLGCVDSRYNTGNHNLYQITSLTSGASWCMDATWLQDIEDYDDNWGDISPQFSEAQFNACKELLEAQGCGQ